MDIDIKNNNFANPTILEIADKRTYQHLALLVDRDDFKNDINKIRTTVLIKYFSPLKSRLEQYLPTIPKEIFEILEKYRYSPDLAEAILSLITSNKITNQEVRKYQPKIGKPKSKLRGYFSHPIDFRLDNKIKIHRQWFLLYNQNDNVTQNVYLGYREISKTIGKSYTTIATAIKSYQRKLGIPIN